MRGVVIPLRGSVMGAPVLFKRLWIASGLREGSCWRRRAVAPATWGEAWEVPRYVEMPPPRPVEVMSAPGASRSSADPPFEKQVTRSAAVCASVQTLGRGTGPRELS